MEIVANPETGAYHEVKPKRFKLTPQQEQAMELLASDASDIAIGGGSRSGKTFMFVRAVIIRAMRAPRSRHAILRFRQNSLVQAVVMGTFREVMDKCWPGLYGERNLNKTLWFYTLPNGSEIWFAGLDDKERVEKILGNEYATMYFNECSHIPYQSVTLALTRLAQKTDELELKAYYDFNPPSKRHWTFLQFVEKLDPTTRKHLLQPDLYAFLFMNPLDNKENLDKAYLERLNALPEKERKRFFLGQFSDENNDALWTTESLDACRFIPDGEKIKLPDMVRLVIAVDPSGCEGDEDDRSDEIGITVGGLGTDGYGYLLEDLSGHFGPSTWGQIVADTYERRQADKVVGEGNYGGAMVKHVIATAAGEQDIPVEIVSATRGKVVRASPIASLFDRGKIRLAGYFPEAEEQACGFYPDGYKGLKSPDRWDSVIWLFTDLFPGLVKNDQGRGQEWRPPEVRSAPRAASTHTMRRRAPSPRRRP